MYPGNAAAITVSDTVDLPQPSIIYVGDFGNVSVITAFGNTVTFTGLNSGQVIPVQVRRVLSTGTTVASPNTNLLAIF
jgi:hypothetical protein